MEKVLKEIGLTDSEIKVYLSLLKIGDSTRGQIVNTAGIAGSKVYEILEKLQEKGLVSIYNQNNVRHFKATNPKQILNYLNDKKDKIRDVELEVNRMLPNLLNMFSSSKEEQEVELLTGLKGLEIIFREQIDIMSKGDTCYVIGGTRGSNEDSMQAFFQKIHLLRTEKGIKTKMLYNLGQKEIVSKLYSSRYYSGVETRFIEHTSPVAINIYADRTVIIIFGKKITSIHIKSQDVANSFLEYFNLLWKTSKK